MADDDDEVSRATEWEKKCKATSRCFGYKIIARAPVAASAKKRERESEGE